MDTTVMLEAPVSFQGQNLTLDEYDSLLEEQQLRYSANVEERNREWLQQKFDELRADWLFVVDSEVILHGKMRDYPLTDELDSLCKRVGKVPFLFANPCRLIIEEVSWHRTSIGDEEDFYPAIRVSLSPPTGVVTITEDGDFDTGTVDIYADHNWLIDKELLTPTERLIWLPAYHSGKEYSYAFYRLIVSLTDEASSTKQVPYAVRCVRKWETTPFVAQNPHRVLLVGRGPLQELELTVHLDFRDRATRVFYPTQQ